MNTPTGVLTPYEDELLRTVRNKYLKDEIATKLADIIDRLTASAEQVRREARDMALMECHDLCERYDDCSPSFIAEKIMERALITPQKEGEDNGQI